MVNVEPFLQELTGNTLGSYGIPSHTKNPQNNVAKLVLNRIAGGPLTTDFPCSLWIILGPSPGPPTPSTHR